VVHGVSGVAGPIGAAGVHNPEFIGSIASNWPSSGGGAVALGGITVVRVDVAWGGG